jgi:hypothetical protein
MTMLMHTRGPFKPASYSSGERDTAGTGITNAHLAIVRQFCRYALTMLIVGGVVAGIIALKAAIALSRLSY